MDDGLMPSENDLNASFERLDSDHEQTKHEVKRISERVGTIESDIHQISSDMRRMEDRREGDRALLIEIRGSIAEIQEANKASTHGLHKRIDTLQEENAVNRGIEQGRRETRSLMFKWIGGIVGIIAILGYIGSQQANAQKLVREAAPVKPYLKHERKDD